MRLKKEIRRYYNSLDMPEMKKIIPGVYIKKERRFRTAVYIGIAVLSVISVILFGFNVTFRNEKTNSDKGDNLFTTESVDIVDPWMPFYYPFEHAELAVKGKYISVSETENNGETYYIYEIAVDGTYKGDNMDDKVIQVIGKKQLSYNYYRYKDDWDKFRHQTVVFFDQVAIDDEVFLFLNESSVKIEGVEDNFYTIMYYVLYVDDKGDIYQVRDPYHWTEDEYKDRTERIRKQPKNKQYIPTFINVYEDVEKIMEHLERVKQRK